MISTDEGAARLGEVALVPHSSPISRSGIVFNNTLFDENAASHIAVGQSYSDTMANGGSMSKDALAKAGANASLIHVDWMIGSGAARYRRRAPGRDGGASDAPRRVGGLAFHPRARA